jgi:hypothetical protein
VRRIECLNQELASDEVRTKISVNQGQTAQKLGGGMIHFLANVFRGLSFIFGITAPPPEDDQRSFVFMWLGMIVVLLGFFVLMLYAISHVRLS